GKERSRSAPGVVRPRGNERIAKSDPTANAPLRFRSRSTKPLRVERATTVDSSEPSSRSASGLSFNGSFRGAIPLQHGYPPPAVARHEREGGERERSEQEQRPVVPERLVMELDRVLAGCDRNADEARRQHLR